MLADENILNLCIKQIAVSPVLFKSQLFYVSFVFFETIYDAWPPLGSFLRSAYLNAFSACQD